MADASTPQPIHLNDYRVPPAAGEGLPPLVLDGQELELVGVRLDGEPLGANRYSQGDEDLTIDAPPAAFELPPPLRAR
jgi:aminopeptidase N